MAEITLSKAELVALTSYELPCKQLARLHADGFHRARIGRDGVILTRAHYEAVEEGRSEKPHKSANIGFLRKAA
jgi:hypothetical protein